MAKGLVLIVEDEREIAELIRFHVEREGFEAVEAHSGADALRIAERKAPTLVLLDIMLPDLDGLEVCRRLKAEPVTATTPIIMLSAKGEEADIVSGLELGADDYLPKPFSPRVLIARMRSVLRRGPEAPATKNEQTLLRCAGGRLAIDAGRHSAMVDGEETPLTLTEFRLLECLAQRPGFVRTRDQIVSAVHGPGAVLSSRAVDVHVAALRRKLGDVGNTIETVRGVGYRMADTHGAAVPDAHAEK